MVGIIYDPFNVGLEFLNIKGKKIKVRKYHMSEDEMGILRMKWLEELSFFQPEKVKKLRALTGKKFFNPYRRGIYYNQIQALFLLGANRWHSFRMVLDKIKSYMLNIPISDDKIFTNTWDKFRGKGARIFASRCKDYQGRIQENFIFLQRLSKLHPYGYKLRQVKAAIDIKRVNKKGISNGLYYYRLSTYRRISQALPIRDFSNYIFPKHEKKYISYRFLGIIITRDKRIVLGVEK